MREDHVSEIAAGYGLGPPVALPIVSGRGEQGQVWQLTTASGQYALKELFIRQDEAEAAVDVAYQEAVLETGAVSLPTPLRRTDGAVLTEVGPHQVRLYTWHDLLAVDRGLDTALVGRTYAAIHGVRHGPTRPLDGWFVDPVGAERWAVLLEESVVAGAPFVGALEAEIPYLVELEGLLEMPADLRMCHRDLWSDNLLAMPDGGVCVIDWENCGLADPAQELPMAMVDLCFDDRERTTAFYSAYLDAGGPARLRERSDFTMLIAQFGHFWETAVAAYVDPSASEDTKAHSVDRVAESAGTPLRVEHIDAILDWIAQG